MLPFLNNKIGIEGSVSEPIKRTPDNGESSESDFEKAIQDLQLAHDIIDNDTEDDRLAKALIKSAMELLHKGNE